MLSESDLTAGALFAQTSVIRTDPLADLFHAALLLGSQPLPTGYRVGIITNAGGPAILCTDACQDSGLVERQLTTEVREGLADFLPGTASTRNPVYLFAAP